jgi:two-component system, OmpR family, heavy metal sensor histidine kinase CusS
MFFDRLSVIVRSLRFRLMLWNAGAVALTGVAILFAVREGVRRTLVRELDEVLNEDLREIELFLQSPRYRWANLTEELSRKAQGHDFHRWFVQFYGADGEPGWSSLHTPALPAFTPEQRKQRAFSVNDLGKPARGGRGPTTPMAAAPPLDEDYRVSYRELPRPLPEAAAVCVGCSQRYLARDLATIDRQVLMVGLAVLTISPLVGHLLTNRVIRPLAQMIRTTARLRPGELAQRVPVRGTGDELDSLARTINGLLDRIADYLQQEHDFLANAAHDLRTPLAAIRSNVEVALSGTRSEEEYRELLGLVIEQCSALQTLVNQLLLLAETESDRLQMDAEPVQLDQLVRRVASMFEGVAEECGVELVMSQIEQVAVAGNRHHLRQVVSNLLDNAIKFTAARLGGDDGDAAPGRVTVELRRDAGANRVRLRVADNGIGIDAQHLPHIFDRFYRADKSRARDGIAGGTGLGLSICKAIVDAHRGTIHAKSEPGEGATFTVVLPLTSPLAASRIAVASGETPAPLI